MKKGLLTTVLLALGLATAQGQTIVRGHIVNERGEGIEYVNILQKPIYEIIKQENGKHTLDVRPEETLLLKRKKDYYLSVRVVDSDSPGYLYMKAYLKNGLYRRVVKGKQRKFPICPALRIKGYEAEAAR